MRTTSTRVFHLIVAAIVMPLGIQAGELLCSQTGAWSLPFSENAKGIVVSGSTAYVAAGNDGLKLSISA